MILCMCFGASHKNKLLLYVDTYSTNLVVLDKRSLMNYKAFFYKKSVLSVSTQS